MNCHSCQKLLLLVFSGEAGWWQRMRAERHVRKCESCRRYRRDLIETERILRSRRAEPAVPVVHAILAYGRRACIRREPGARGLAKDTAWVLLRPAWLYGALSVLALLGFLALMEPALRPPRREVAIQYSTPPAGPPNTVVEEMDSDIEARLDELAWMLDATYLDNLTSAAAESGVRWTATEQLAAELLAWEDAQI